MVMVPEPASRMMASDVIPEPPVAPVMEMFPVVVVTLEVAPAKLIVGEMKETFPAAVMAPLMTMESVAPVPVLNVRFVIPAAVASALVMTKSSSLAPTMVLVSIIRLVVL